MSKAVHRVQTDQGVPMGIIDQHRSGEFTRGDRMHCSRRPAMPAQPDIGGAWQGAHAQRPGCFRTHRPHAPRGFSYLWVLMLVAMMGFGLTLASQLDATLAARERERELLAVGRQLRAAIESYHRTPTPSGKPEYPRTLDDLIADPRVPGLRRHLRKVFVDPMTGTTDWGLVMIDGHIAGVFSKSGKSPIKRSNFQPEEAAFELATRYADWRFVFPAEIPPHPPQPGSAHPDRKELETR